MLVMFECTVVGQRLRNLRELRALSTPKQAVQVHRQGRWERLPGDALLPGDLISLGRPAGGAPPAALAASTTRSRQQLPAASDGGCAPGAGCGSRGLPSCSAVACELPRPARVWGTRGRGAAAGRGRPRGAR